MHLEVKMPKICANDVLKKQRSNKEGTKHIAFLAENA